MTSSVQATASGLHPSDSEDLSCTARAPDAPRSVARGVTAVEPARGATEESMLDTTVISGDTARMLKTLLGNLDGMVYRCRDDDSWTMEFISDGCRRLTGYDPNDLLLNNRLSYESITHPDDRPRVREEVHSSLALRNRFDVEYRIKHANGEIRASLQPKL